MLHSEISEILDRISVSGIVLDRSGAILQMSDDWRDQSNKWTTRRNVAVGKNYFEYCIRPDQHSIEILRVFKDLLAGTMLDERATTPLRRVDLCVQKIYLGRDGVDTAQYHQSVQALLAAMPSAQSTVAAANTQIAKGSLYGALREHRKLLETEPASDSWRAELLGVFQETKRPADGPRTSPIVIRALRRGRSGTRSPSYRRTEQPRSEVA